MSGCPLVLFRVDHHSRRREYSSCAHRGSSEEGATNNQQCHAHRGQEEIFVNAFDPEGNLLFCFVFMEIMENYILYCILGINPVLCKVTLCSWLSEETFKAKIYIEIYIYRFKIPGLLILCSSVVAIQKPWRQQRS